MKKPNKNRSPASSESVGVSSSSSASSSSPTLVAPRANIWIVHDAVYDLTNFVSYHPGGYILDGMRNRDCTAQIYAYHVNVPLVFKVLAEYKIGTLQIEQNATQFRMDRPRIRDYPAIQPSDALPIPHPTPSNAIHLPESTVAPPPWVFPELNTTQEFAHAFYLQNKATDFTSPMLTNIKQKLAQGNMKKNIAAQNWKFRIHTLYLILAYLLLQASVYFKGSSCLISSFNHLFDISYLFYSISYVFLIVCLRSALSCAGHYFLHTPSCWYSCFGIELFDMNYVGVYYINGDGHVLLHHVYTKTQLDSKDTAITGFRSLPRGYRVVIHTLHKFGQLILGAALRQCVIFMGSIDGLLSGWMKDPLPLARRGKLNDKPNATSSFSIINILRKMITFLFILITFFYSRIVLIMECYWFYSNGLFFIFFLQFFVCLWFNTAVLLSNHDYIHSTPFNQLFGLDGREKLRKHQPNNTNNTNSHHSNNNNNNQSITSKQSSHSASAHDSSHSSMVNWAEFQLASTHDISIVGNDYIDCWLSAGLSCHRVHHLLPYQSSPYANIVSTHLVRECVLQQQLEWLPAKSFFQQCVHEFTQDYITSPPHISARIAFSLGIEQYQNLTDAQLNEVLPPHYLYSSIFEEHFSFQALVSVFWHLFYGFLGLNI